MQVFISFLSRAVAGLSVFFGIQFASAQANFEVYEAAINAIQTQCKLPVQAQDISESITVDSGHDYVTYFFAFEQGPSVTVTQVFEGGKKVSFWVDEVECR